MGENLHPSNSIFLLIIHLTSQPLAALKLPINPRYFIKIVKSEKIIHNQYYGMFEVPEWPEISCHEKKHQKKRNAKIHENVFLKVFNGVSPNLGLGEMALKGRPTSIRSRKCLEIKIDFDIHNFQNTRTKRMGKWTGKHEKTMKL